MNHDDEVISREIKRIADPRAVVVLSGVVKTANAGDNTVDVVLTGDGDAVEVLNNVVVGNVAGMYAIPEDGADCEVAELDGPGKWTMIRASKYKKWYAKAGGKFVDITDSVVLLNGDGNGGLVKVKECADKIKAVEQLVNNILQVLQTTTIPLAPSGTYPFAPLYASITPISPLTSSNDLENKNVKHG